YFTPNDFIVEEEQELSESIATWMDNFIKDKYKALYHLGFLEKQKWFSPSLEYLHHISQLLVRRISRQPDLEISREAIIVELSNEEIDNLIDDAPFAIGIEHITKLWIKGLWESLLMIFKGEIKDFDGTVGRYFAELNSDINIAGRVFFHLVENNDMQYPFAFMASYSTKPAKSKRAVHTPLKNALAEFDGDEKRLLNLISAVVKAAEKSDFISGLLESGELFSPIKLTVEEAYTLLKEIPLYEDAGIMCRVPNWWRKKSNSLGISITVGEKEPSKVGLNAILDFGLDFKLGDEVLTSEELNEFLKMAEGLVKYKGKWVEVSKSKLNTLLLAFDNAKEMMEDGELSIGEAMRLELKGKELLENSPDEIQISISNGQWLKEMSKNLIQPIRLAKVATAPTFKGSLRPYQENGYHWLYQMSKLKFGACLADDMGLGKTIQMIAYLEYMRTNHGGQALLVLPASLIGNWQREIEKFAPEMPYRILHKSALKGKEEMQIDGEYFLYITTYGMANKLEELKAKVWDYLILDEAQAIKNPGTKQTKNIKLIPAKMRFAMTGTPIENRLGDLWSLFDFLNQGLLGSAKEFTNFTAELKEHSGGYTRLRKVVQPFILRRVKTDKSIISDLPDKVEIEAYTTLTNKQMVLYRQLANQIKEMLETSEGIERKGLVLASIMKFKQICNHPDQYIGREEYKPGQSGKFEQMRDICETIREKRERVLVFTQFREMTEPISDYLNEIFGKKGFVLHGGTPVKKRSEVVEQFNGEQYIPYMVLSLKAGGVGLNLTAANHVIHFDRWWNPAVENQATDRVFRIGQTKDVMVHKFITKDTIEEKIDAILKEKRSLSSELLGSDGEHWITEYSNDELIELFSLDGDRA
ncbi:MAG TPA: DEAD/DEAH box helicase, partial [Anaerovoracaceae bacterium]|nr:DEAD/DEAH box helicase [Anaerovoracaceae bacterium]